MKAVTYPNAEDFLRRAQPYLEANESANSLMLGIALRLISHPDWTDFPCFLATIESNGAILLAATMTPPNAIVLSGAADAPQESLQALVESLQTNRWQPPGVNGPKELAGRFARLWTAANDLPCRVKVEERLFELRQVTPPQYSPGHLRQATVEDQEILTGWQIAFLREALGEENTEAVQRNTARRIAAGYAYVWDDRGPVSVAIKGRSTPHGNSIGGVYTPPEYRGRGYATSCVAALSQQLLDSGKQFCNLFTDLANPTSNSIYQKIGYKPVYDFTLYHFDAE